MRIVSRPLYRVRQVGWALRPNVKEEEQNETRHLLGEQLFALFTAMEPTDQRHCLDVYQAARRAGCEDTEVLTAALIHDCGKAPSAEDGRIRLWHRITYVVLATAAPVLLRRMARRPGGLRLLHSHGERGLELAASHGATLEVLELMRQIEDGGDADERVRLLRAADDAT